MCTSCMSFLTSHRGGAEIEGTMLFADIRGSTSLAESMSPTAFRELLDRFYAVATNVVFAHDGTIDKFVGDELVALFVPLLSGAGHPAQAVEAARDLLRATGHADDGGPWVPVGAGVHTGTVWFGTIGDDRHLEVTALGDAMNTTARLAAVAGTGEVLVSWATASAAGLDMDLERRRLELKGKAEMTEVVTLSVGPSRPTR
jgi:adenylate cyclase